MLIDSEPFWQAAELDVFGLLGVPLTKTMCRETMGFRLDEVVDHWYRRYPWKHVDSLQCVDARLLERFVPRADG